MLDWVNWLDGLGRSRVVPACPTAAMDLNRCDPTPGAANTAYTPPECGDGEVEGDEVCDGDSVRHHLRRADARRRDCSLRGRLHELRHQRCAALARDSLVINEASSAGDDFIEILNAGEAKVRPGRWIVVDDGTDPTDEMARFQFAAGTLAPGARVTLRKDIDHSFGLGDADGVRLYDPEGNLVDTTDWGDRAARSSWCRLPDGEGEFTSCRPTPAVENEAAECGDARVEANEICDGELLEGATCRTQGFDGGELGCNDDCLGYDTSACESSASGHQRTLGARRRPHRALQRWRASGEPGGLAIADQGFDLEDPMGTAEQHTCSATSSSRPVRSTSCARTSITSSAWAEKTVCGCSTPPVSWSTRSIGETVTPTPAIVAYPNGSAHFRPARP